MTRVEASLQHGNLIPFWCYIENFHNFLAPQLTHPNYPVIYSATTFPVSMFGPPLFFTPMTGCRVSSISFHSPSYSFVPWVSHWQPWLFFFLPCHVSFDECIVRYFSSSSGVPEDSILGSLLFSFFINNIPIPYLSVFALCRWLWTAFRVIIAGTLPLARFPLSWRIFLIKLELHSVPQSHFRLEAPLRYQMPRSH